MKKYKVIEVERFCSRLPTCGVESDDHIIHAAAMNYLHHGYPLRDSFVKHFLDNGITIDNSVINFCLRFIRFHLPNYEANERINGDTFRSAFSSGQAHRGTTTTRWKTWKGNKTPIDLLTDTEDDADLNTIDDYDYSPTHSSQTDHAACSSVQERSNRISVARDKAKAKRVLPAIAIGEPEDSGCEEVTHRIIDVREFMDIVNRVVDGVGNSVNKPKIYLWLSCESTSTAIELIQDRLPSFLKYLIDVGDIYNESGHCITDPTGSTVVFFSTLPAPSMNDEVGVSIGGWSIRTEL